MMSAPDSPIALRKRLDQKVRTFALDRQLWPEQGTILLAVSGGPDSTALLLILHRLARYQQFNLHVACFDHGLRGPEAAEREQAFVAGLCQSLGVQCFTGSGDVQARAKAEGLSIEEAARRERYEFLASTATQCGASIVATGHTASDQAETVLMHLVRGAGLEGLSGMAPRSAWPVPGGEALALLRPLLCLSRAETVAYCEAAEVTPVLDESNGSPEYTRNRIRNELVPLLRTFNPRIEDALVRLAEASSLVRLPPPEPGAALNRTGTPARPEVIRQTLAAAAGDLRGFSAANVDAIQRLLVYGATGDSLDLPRGLQATVSRSSVVLAAQDDRLPLLPEGSVEVKPELPAVFGWLWLRAGQAVIADATASVEVDAAVVSGLQVRRRREGDRFQPLGMQQEKKLQDFFVDAHVPREERDRIPLFVVDQGIIWVGGMRIAEWARPRPGLPTVWLSYRG